MSVRRAFYGWLLPAAFVLPLWLLIAWAIAGFDGWGFVWLLAAMPTVLVTQLVLTLLVRARTRARTRREVSWWDVGGFTLWHSLTVALGFWAQPWWAPMLVLTICVGVALFWLELWQLWRQATTSRIILSAVTGRESLSPRSHEERMSELARQRREVIVISEGGPQPGVHRTGR